MIPVNCVHKTDNRNQVTKYIICMYIYYVYLYVWRVYKSKPMYMIHFFKKIRRFYLLSMQVHLVATILPNMSGCVKNVNPNENVQRR